ncbi:hypothetical protein THAOC_22238 [Thalassiosira oceanica]|uniref:Uncharacterized protein n=1 Tax=Thalassiosira oceanica TaxID=159749 RepID=K0RZ46_THAOC|nr:hypothetical protein THAOC_22238 [Thalassiosira oceanica]|eukprot:EJK57689.1 hypothetical protein THAOC_22238 [Thalassiosira oceanica]
MLDSCHLCLCPPVDLDGRACNRATTTTSDDVVELRFVVVVAIFLSVGYTIQEWYHRGQSMMVRSTMVSTSISCSPGELEGWSRPQNWTSDQGYATAGFGKRSIVASREGTPKWRYEDWPKSEGGPSPLAGWPSPGPLHNIGIVGTKPNEGRPNPKRDAAVERLQIEDFQQAETANPVPPSSRTPITGVPIQRIWAEESNSRRGKPQSKRRFYLACTLTKLSKDRASSVLGSVTLNR